MNRNDYQEKIVFLINHYGMSHMMQPVVDAIKPSIRMKTIPRKDEDIPVGASKIGGMPDLPIDWQWPMCDDSPLDFVAQIAFSDTDIYDTEHVLPTSGIAYFFFDIDMYFNDWNHQERFSKVMFYNGDISQLCRAPIPSSIPLYEEEHITSPCVVEFFFDFTIPPLDSLPLYTMNVGDHYFDMLEDVEKLYDDTGTARPSIHRLLGHPDAIQNDMQVECQFVFEKLIPQYPASEAIRTSAEVWTLLLQIDSDENIKRDWGDSGRLYFWIRSDDLRERNFESVYCILQCY